MVGKGVDWEAKFKEEEKSANKWEFKFNKLRNQLQSILTEAGK